MDLEQLSGLIKVPGDKVRRISRVVLRNAFIVALGYVAASMTSDFVMYSMLSSSMPQILAGKRPRAVASIDLDRPNYRDIRMAIEDRNVFNETGEFPDESNPDLQQQRQTSTSDFDINAPCAESSLPLELLGTIYMSGDGSLATIQEQGYAQADVYREGDLIIGYDQAQIIRIDRQKVVINNGGIKECLEHEQKDDRRGGGGFPDVEPSVGGFASNAPKPNSGGGDGDCELTEKYVQDQLGPGFGTIIQKARLVPNTTNNVMNGFKIFAIDKSSLLAKVGLENGDIITQVNEVSLKQPEQGFALYQAFQDEREIVISVLRKGKTPKTITCRIR